MKRNRRRIIVGREDKSALNNKTAKKGTKYTYTVRCVSADGKTFTSAYNTTGLSIVKK